MLHVTPDELTRLKASLTSLESVLQTLDEIGAGIAAIHVDAAITQLRNNIEVVIDNTAAATGISGSCASEQPIASR